MAEVSKPVPGTTAVRPPGRATWRKVRSDHPVYGPSSYYQGVLVDDGGTVTWESAGEAATIWAARRDAKHGGPHWSIDGERNGFSPDWAWLPWDRSKHRGR